MDPGQVLDARCALLEKRRQNSDHRNPLRARGRPLIPAVQPNQRIVHDDDRSGPRPPHGGGDLRGRRVLGKIMNLEIERRAQLVLQPLQHLLRKRRVGHEHEQGRCVGTAGKALGRDEWSERPRTRSPHRPRQDS